MLGQFFSSLPEKVIVTGTVLLLTFVSILMISFIFGRFIKNAAKKKLRSERRKRIATFLTTLKRVLIVIVIIIGIFTVISESGLDIGPLLATAGIGALALSLGAQSFIKDLISGFFILSENQIRVGDVVKIGDHGGQVESMNIRNIILRDLAGNVHIIPNGKIEEVVNMTKEFSKAVLDIGVAYSENIDVVISTIEDEGQMLCLDGKFGKLLKEPIEVLGVEDFADSAILIRVVLTTTPQNQWEVAREFRKRIKHRFDIEGIEIPFPHRKIIFSNDFLKNDKRKTDESS